MSIVDLVQETIANEQVQGLRDNKLEEALNLYHEMVRKKIIVPRENQLVCETVEFKAHSNLL